MARTCLSSPFRDQLALGLVAVLLGSNALRAEPRDECMLFPGRILLTDTRNAMLLKGDVEGDGVDELIVLASDPEGAVFRRSGDSYEKFSTFSVEPFNE